MKKKSKSISERNLNPKSKRVYTLNDLSKWVKYGISLGVINRSGEKEDLEMIMKWIDMLDRGNINL